MGIIACDLKDWIGVIGALGGAVIGGTIAMFVAYRQLNQQRQLEHKKHQLANCENIHEYLSTIAHQAGIMSTQVIGHIGAGVPFKADALGGKVPMDKLRMLVDFYAPSLKPEVDRIGEQWLVLGRAVAEAIITETRTDDWKAKTVLAAASASAEILRESEMAKAKLNELAKPLT